METLYIKIQSTDLFVACSNQHNNDVCQISETSEKHVKECYVNWYQKDVLVYTKKLESHICFCVDKTTDIFYSGRVNWKIQGFEESIS